MVDDVAFAAHGSVPASGSAVVFLLAAAGCQEHLGAATTASWLGYEAVFRDLIARLVDFRAFGARAAVSFTLLFPDESATASLAAGASFGNLRGELLPAHFAELVL